VTPDTRFLKAQGSTTVEIACELLQILLVVTPESPELTDHFHFLNRGSLVRAALITGENPAAVKSIGVRSAGHLEVDG
jgi:hypothetical protein